MLYLIHCYIIICLHNYLWTLEQHWQGSWRSWTRCHCYRVSSQHDVQCFILESPSAVMCITFVKALTHLESTRIRIFRSKLSWVDWDILKTGVKGRSLHSILASKGAQLCLLHVFRWLSIYLQMRDLAQIHAKLLRISLFPSNLKNCWVESRLAWNCGCKSANHLQPAGLCQYYSQVPQQAGSIIGYCKWLDSLFLKAIHQCRESGFWGMIFWRVAVGTGRVKVF